MSPESNDGTGSGRGDLPVVIDEQRAAFEGALAGSRDKREAPEVLECPPEDFGGEHWELLRHLEERVVERPAAVAASARGSAGARVKGAGMPAVSYLCRERMRCNPARHPEAAAVRHMAAQQKARLQTLAGAPDGGAALGVYPLWEQSGCSTLGDGSRALHHDDYDCLADLERAKFVRMVSWKRAIFALTEAGMRAAHAYRVHRAMGGGPGEFALSSSKRLTG